MIRRILYFSVLILFSCGALFAADAPVFRLAQESAQMTSSNRIVVKMRPSSKAGGNSISALSSTISSISLLAGAKTERGLGFGNWSVVSLPANISVENAKRLLSGRSDILAVEQVHQIHTLLPQPNDPYFAQVYSEPEAPEISWPYMWNMANISANDAWSIYPGVYYNAQTKPIDAIRIAVIDSGIDYTHPDFINYGGSSSDISDGGQIDFARGCSILQGVQEFGPDAFADLSGHGTHVSGIAAAAGNNYTGVIGVGYNAVIVPIRVVSGDGTGDDTDLAMAIKYAADESIPIINVSLGSTDYSRVLMEAVNYAYYKGSLIIAAANESSSGGGDLGKMYPAADSKVLAVSPTGIDDDFPSDVYAGYGDYIGISAPSGGFKYFSIDFDGDGEPDFDWPQLTPIWSTAPTYPVGIELDQLGNDFQNYGSLLGTSMATPHVSGLAALYGAYKNYSIQTHGGNLAIWRAIQLGADNAQGTLNGAYDIRYGFGRINAQQTLLDANTRGATTGAISGQVFYRGTPIASADVQIQKMTGGPITSTTTKVNGLWKIYNVSPGLYKVTSTVYAERKILTNVEIVAGADTPGADAWIGDSSMQIDTTASDMPSVEYISYTTSYTSSLQAKWWSIDLESGIASYQVAIGTTPGATDVMNWTDMGWKTQDTFNIASANNQVCYVSVKAINGAGLTSAVGYPNMLSAGLVLEDYTLPNPNALTFEIRNPGQTVAIGSYLVRKDSSGYYEIPGLGSGSWDLSTKLTTFLRSTKNVLVNPSGSSSLTLSLTNGDCDGDNEITSTDLSILGLALGSVLGDASWDIQADLDGDGEVTSTDLSILGISLGINGDL